MWKKNNNINRINNRINFIVVIIFLLGGLILYKLYILQIKNYDFYIAKALNQHQIFNELKPARGKILLRTNDEQKLYELAINKDFVDVYAVPKNIIDPEKIAEKLYFVFHKEKIEKEVDIFFRKQEEKRMEDELAFLINSIPDNESDSSRISSLKTEIKQKYQTLKLDKEYQELINIKKQAEIELRKNTIIKKYLDIFSKKNDPYEPIESKVDDNTLKKLYANLLNKEDYEVAAEDLEIQHNKIFLKKTNKEINLNNIAYKIKSYRFYPEGNIGSHILGFVSYAEHEPHGKYGLEGFFDQELFGQYGSIQTEQSAEKDVIIINNRKYIQPRNGSDLVLTIDQSIQFNICQKLNQAVLKHNADSGSVIIVEPKSGKIIAMCSWPDFDPNNYQDVDNIQVYNNPSIFDQYEPGSVFKSITIAAAIDQNKITPETTYNDKGQTIIYGWPKPIRNSDYETRGGHGIVNMNTVLSESLNTGAIFAMQQAGAAVFANYVKKFGFGEKTGIELETESKGNITNLLNKKIKPIDAAVASFGQGIAVTPLQMIMAYSAIANKGILMKPYIVQEIIYNNNTKSITRPMQIRRVISEKTATLLSGMLVNVVENGHAKLAKIDGYYLGGKTGTAQVASSKKRGWSNKTIHTFIGFGPVDNPRFVILTKLDHPKNAKFAESSAVPLFRQIVEFVLNFYQIPEDNE